MQKSPDAFRSIGEVSRLVGVAPHVLRYWEAQFTQLSPVKRADGRRYYRPDDVRLAAGLCQVLREEGLSIRGAKRLIAADRGAGLRDIGAARLGEVLGGDGDAPRPPPAPAVRLAVPGAETATMEREAATAPTLERPSADSNTAASKPVDSQLAQPTPAQASPARHGQTTAADSLPLFPELGLIPPGEWLARLVETAAALRERGRAERPLPAGARALRDGLRAAK